MKYRSARQMIFEAFQCHPQSTMAGVAERAKLGREIQETRRQNQDGKIVHGLEAGMVISRVESLPEIQRSLVLAAFGPFTRAELRPDAERVAAALAKRIVDDQIRLPSQADAVQLYRLCQAAVHHHLETTWPFRRQGLATPQAVRSWMAGRGVTLEGRWTQEGRPGWSRVWTRCLDLMSDWEGAGLAPVAELLQEDREARRRDRAPA